MTERNKIMRDIAGLPHDNPTECEGLIRRLSKQISALQDAGEKEKLLTELKTVASFGIHKDLKQMMEAKGLQLEGLNLVLKHVTKVPDLAKFLYLNLRTPKEVEDAGLEIVSMKLGPDLEVLGGLSAAGIAVTKEWVKNLCKKAPSLQTLTRLRLSELENCCQGADEGEMDEVYRLVEYGESHRNQLAYIPQDENIVQQNEKIKAVDKANLKRTKDLMEEVKSVVTDHSEASKKIVIDKIAEIVNILELPSKWLKQGNIKPKQLFRQLDRIIEQCTSEVESAESYNSELEIVTRASAGRALCGIYHSEYEPPKPAGRPLLQVPTTLTLTNPNSAEETKYIEFSEKGLASEYVEKVTSSSTTVGLCVSGLHGLFSGEVEGGYKQERQAFHFDQAYNTTASALCYMRTAKKTFQLERNKIRLTLTASRRAKAIVQNENANREGSAREFLERYGSHFPAGVQTLGGLFFCIVDSESESTTETLQLSKAAVKHLKSQISAGCPGGALGIGAGATGEHSGGEGGNIQNQRESSAESFTCYVKSMGPPANPATFNKLLSYSSNWALIDRGSFQGYLKVWELIRDLGSEFGEVAQILEETWRKDELEREKKWQARRKAEEMIKAKRELQRIKKEHLRCEVGTLIYSVYST